MPKLINGAFIVYYIIVFNYESESFLCLQSGDDQS